MGVVLFLENNQQQDDVMMQSYRHHPEFDYFPLTARAKVFYSSYPLLN